MTRLIELWRGLFRCAHTPVKVVEKQLELFIIAEHTRVGLGDKPVFHKIYVCSKCGGLYLGNNK